MIDAVRAALTSRCLIKGFFLCVAPQFTCKRVNQNATAASFRTSLVKFSVAESRPGYHLTREPVSVQLVSSEFA
jgi:hypothetical protein